jgi:adenylate cyclase
VSATGRRRIRRRHLRLRIALLVLVAAVAIGVALLARSTPALDRIELDLIDARFELRGGVAPREDVVFVELDTRTLRALDLQLPYPRSVHARAIERIAAAQPTVIAYDFQFVGPTRPREDRALVRAIERARPVVLAASDNGRRSLRIPAGEPSPGKLGARLGAIELLTDDDGVIRQMGDRFGRIESFAVVTAQIATGRQVPGSEFTDGDAWIDYRGPPGAIPSVSFIDVLRGRVQPAELADKVVVVGATDPDFKDVFAVPATADPMPGAEIHANAISTILDGFSLRDAPAWLDIGLIIGLTLIVVGVAVRFTSLPVVLTGAAALVALLVGAQLAFNAGLIVAVLYPAIAVAIAMPGAAAVDFLVESRERRRTRQVFARFVPRGLVDELIARTDDDLRLGGETMEATVVFCDLRGFSAFAERNTAAAVIRVLNRYLTEVSDAIRRHGGTVVSYMGDGVMAVFGAPLEQPDHAVRALRAALEIRDERLTAFNAWFRAEGLGDGFSIGLGLCTGPVMSGNVGSRDRLEYAAVGDTTNVAARLQAKNKETGTQILIAESTRTLLGGDVRGLTFVGEHALAGRAAPMRLWTVAQVGATDMGDLAATDAGGPPDPDERPNVSNR